MSALAPYAYLAFLAPWLPWRWVWKRASRAPDGGSNVAPVLDRSFRASTRKVGGVGNEPRAGATS